MSKADYAETLVLKYLLSTDAVTRPPAVYMALHTEDPTETGDVGELAVGNGYARQAIVFDTSAVPFVNTNTVLFGPCTVAAWGGVSHMSLKDAAVGGNTLYKAPIVDEEGEPTPKVISVTDKLEFGPESVVVDED